MRLDIHNKDLTEQYILSIFNRYYYTDKIDKWFAQIIVNRDVYRVSGLYRDAISVIQSRLNADMSIYSYRSGYEEIVVSSYSKYLSNQLTYKLPDHYDR